MVVQILFAVALSFGALSSSGQDKPAQDAAQDKGIVVTGAKKKYDPDKRICKGSTATGSLMRKVTCRTAGEWEAEREKSVAMLDAMRKDRMSRDNTQFQRENP